MLSVKLETRYPTHQNAVELFGDRWLIKLEELHPGLSSGSENYLRLDDRPAKAARHLGFVQGSLHGMAILELGPMEGAHSYQLSQLGGDVLAIEANSLAYLRCLVMKEILQPARCRFLLGDCLRYLEQNETRYDLIFCSGILYHMADPFSLIAAMARRTDRVFLSTHYYDPADPRGPDCRPRQVARDGLELTFHEHAYQVDLAASPFWGGTAPAAAWLSREDLLRCFEHFGFALSILDERRDLSAGHHITAAALRS